MKNLVVMLALLGVLVTGTAWADNPSPLGNDGPRWPEPGAEPPLGVATVLPASCDTMILDHPVRGTLAAGGERWYKLYIEGTGMLAVVLPGARGEEASLAPEIEIALFNESGEPLGLSGWRDGKFAARADASYDYYFYVRVKARANLAGNADYELVAGLELPPPEFAIPATAGALTAPAEVSGTVIGGGEAWYRVAIPAGAGQYLIAELQGDSVDIDLLVADAEGRLLEKAESGQPFERIAVEVPASGILGVRVYLIESGKTSSYKLKVYAAAEQPTGTYNPRLPQNYREVQVNEAVSDRLANAERWYRYHIEDRGVLKIAFEGRNLELELVNDDGSRAYTGTAGRGTMTLIGNANQFTDFYLKVKGSGEYRFTGTLVSGDYVNVPATAELLRANRDKLGALQVETWYRFKAERDGYVTINFDGGGDTAVDIDLSVVKPDGMVVVTSNTSNSREAVLLPVKRNEEYFIRLFPYQPLATAVNYVVWFTTAPPKR